MRSVPWFVVGCGWMRLKILYIPTWGSSYRSSFELQLVGRGVGGREEFWGGEGCWSGEAGLEVDEAGWRGLVAVVVVAIVVG